MRQALGPRRNPGKSPTPQYVLRIGGGGTIYCTIQYCPPGTQYQYTSLGWLHSEHSEYPIQDLATCSGRHVRSLWAGDTHTHIPTRRSVAGNRGPCVVARDGREHAHSGVWERCRGVGTGRAGAVATGHTLGTELPRQLTHALSALRVKGACRTGMLV